MSYEAWRLRNACQGPCGRLNVDTNFLVTRREWLIFRQTGLCPLCYETTWPSPAYPSASSSSSGQQQPQQQRLGKQQERLNKCMKDLSRVSKQATKAPQARWLYRGHDRPDDLSGAGGRRKRLMDDELLSDTEVCLAEEDDDDDPEPVEEEDDTVGSPDHDDEDIDYGSGQSDQEAEEQGEVDGTGKTTTVDDEQHYCECGFPLPIEEQWCRNC